MGKSYEDTYHSPSHISVITGSILVTIIRFVHYRLLLASNITFMANSLHLGTIQIWQNLNERYYYFTSTKAVICQTDDFSPFQSLNMLPFHIGLECFKLIYYGLISNFSKYYFKTDTICLLFLSSHLFTVLEYDSNHLGILLWEILKLRDHNEIKPPIGKTFQEYKPIRHYFMISQK